MTDEIDAPLVRQWIDRPTELALIDVREAGQFGEGHLFFASNIPYSRLELDAPALLPRLTVPIVLIDDGDGVAQRAARRLQGLGYTSLHVLRGGNASWSAAGHELFKGVNVPSKTFGELVEWRQHTPRIDALTLHERLRSGPPVLLLDGRTPQEHRKMTIPGALPLPNGELARRIGALLSDERTPVVVHCAGRTRSIIGAQTLRDLGIPNPVFALENGTQGWALAGLALEHGSVRELPPLPPDHDPRLALLATRHATRHGVHALSIEQAQAWVDDPERTTYVLDVRTAEEFALATLFGARHAPGGQLVQATDQFIAVRRARALLLDDDGVRAAVSASWLAQMGHEVALVQGGVRADLRLHHCVRSPATPPAHLTGQALWQLAASGTSTVLDLRSSREHRASRASGSRWTTRPRLPPSLSTSVLLMAPSAELAALVAVDLQETGVVVSGWTTWADWTNAGLPLAPGDPATPSDAEAIDYLLFVHDRHDGNLDAARQYLAWETGLLAQCSDQELAPFNASPDTPHCAPPPAQGDRHTLAA